jgi:hypothetical protein
MSKLACILLTAACIAPASVSASTLLVVDLSTDNEITITATDGWSSATVSGNDTTGFYLDGFFGSSPTPLGHTLSTGNLTSALNNSDLTPNLFNFNSDPAGLNVWSYTNDTASDFVEDSIAFSGSATWTVSAVAYSAALAGPSSGLIYFPADHLNDLNDATELGGWARTTVVPLPAAAWLFGTALIGLIGFGKRRKAA